MKLGRAVAAPASDAVVTELPVGTVFTVHANDCAIVWLASIVAVWLVYTVTSAAVTIGAVLGGAGGGFGGIAGGGGGGLLPDDESSPPQAAATMPPASVPQTSESAMNLLVRMVRRGYTKYAARPMTSKRMTRAGLALSIAGATACTSILGDFTVGPATTGNDAGDAQPADVFDSGGPDVQGDGGSDFFGVAKALAAGARHTCALVGTGEVFCWGDNTNGQLAQSAGVTRNARPVKIGLPAPASAISAGAFHTCAISTSNDLYCWGANDSAECGAGDAMNPAPPRLVTSATSGLKWALVAAGEAHTCAVEQGGATYCWGANDKLQSGEVGAGPVNKATNAGPTSKTMFKSIAAASAHSCGTTDTTVHCWGTEFHGELGDGSGAGSSAQGVDIVFMAGAHAVVAGAGHTCVRDANDQIRCWGDDTFGQLGVPADGGTQQLLPGAVIPGGPYQAIATHSNFGCFIASVGGKVSCVGANDFGQLGRGGTTDTAAHIDPQPVISPDAASTPLVATGITAGRDHACAIIAGGGVVCWGNGSDGQLGDGTPGGGARTTPVHVAKP